VLTFSVRILVKIEAFLSSPILVCLFTIYFNALNIIRYLLCLATVFIFSA